MGVQAVQMVSRIFQYAFELFTTILDATGLMSFYLSMLAILFVVVYLLSPFVVTVGSDTVSDKSKFDHPKYGQNSRNYEGKNTRGNGK